MLSITNGEPINISECSELQHITGFRLNQSLADMVSRKSSISSDLTYNGTIEVEVDLTGVVKDGSFFNNKLEILNGKPWSLQVRNKEGVVFHVVTLTKVKSIVNIPVCALVLGTKIKVSNVW